MSEPMFRQAARPIEPLESPASEGCNIPLLRHPGGGALLPLRKRFSYLTVDPRSSHVSRSNAERGP
jgi:hypothetical protein